MKYRRKWSRKNFTAEHRMKAVYLPIPIIEQLDMLVNNHVFPTMSDAIRSAVIAMIQNLQFFLTTTSTSHQSMIDIVKEQLNDSTEWIIIDPAIFDTGRQSMVSFLKRNFPDYIRHRSKFYIKREYMKEYIETFDKYMKDLFKASCAVRGEEDDI